MRELLVSIHYSLPFTLVLLLLIPHIPLKTSSNLDLMAQFKALQVVANSTVDALHARGDDLVACLQDVSVRAREVALHGVRHRAAIALVIA